MTHRQDRNENSLKYYRDLNNVIDTARQEGREEGEQTGQKNLILRLLTRKLGTIPEPLQTQIFDLNAEDIATLSEAIFDLESISDLKTWLRSRP